MVKGRLDGNRWIPHVLRTEVEEREVIQNDTHADFIFPECFSKQFPACEFVYCLWRESWTAEIMQDTDSIIEQDMKPSNHMNQIGQI